MTSLKTVDEVETDNNFKIELRFLRVKALLSWDCCVGEGSEALQALLTTAKLEEKVYLSARAEARGFLQGQSGGSDIAAVHSLRYGL